MYFSKATVQITRLGRSLFLSHWFSCFFLPVIRLSGPFVLLILPGVQSAYASITLQSDQTISTAGYYQLSWKSTEQMSATYIVHEVQAGRGISKEIYRGRDTATVLSGKPDGEYKYLVRSEDGSQLSNPVIVTVKHHSLDLAFNFFWVGAIVFILILIAVVRGNKLNS